MRSRNLVRKIHCPFDPVRKSLVGPSNLCFAIIVFSILGSAIQCLRGHDFLRVHQFYLQAIHYVLVLIWQRIACVQHTRRLNRVQHTKSDSRDSY